MQVGWAVWASGLAEWQLGDEGFSGFFFISLYLALEAYSDEGGGDMSR